MSNNQTKIDIFQSIAQLANKYDAWLCDIWGVLHNGVRAFSPAYGACQRFRDGGGLVVLLTNSPRPSASVMDQLDQVGVPRGGYDCVVSSGDVARRLIANKPGRPIYHLGPERDRGIFAGLDIRLCDPKEADAVLCSGLFDDETETPEDYEPLLVELLARQLPLICANPDVVVQRGDKIIYCAGALAQRYGALGGAVIYTGKPHDAIYDLAMTRLEDIGGARLDRRKILAIGDGLKTDMKGAFDHSIDAIYIASGIHMAGHNETAVLSDTAVEKLFEDTDRKPIAALPRLAW